MADNTEMINKENVKGEEVEQNVMEKNEIQQTNLLETLEKIQKKHLFYQRITCLLILVFVLAVVSVLPSVFRTLHSAETALNNANDAILQAEDTLKDVSGLVVDSEAQINTAMEKINSIDFEGLNAAIGDLQAVVEPMAEFFGKFGKLR